MHDGKIFIAIPTYDGRAEVMTCFRVFCQATNGPLKDRLGFRSETSSVLTQTFNALWSMALTQQQRGADIRYFAMVHADVVPQVGWLDN